jgi:hypothetical protein
MGQAAPTSTGRAFVFLQADFHPALLDLARAKESS